MATDLPNQAHWPAIVSNNNQHTHSVGSSASTSGYSRPVTVVSQRSRGSNGIRQPPRRNGTNTSHDCSEAEFHIVVPSVPVRLKGVEMQLDLKLDHKTLAAAENLSKAVHKAVRSTASPISETVVCKSQGFDSTTSSLCFSPCGSDVRVYNGNGKSPPPSPSSYSSTVLMKTGGKCPRDFLQDKLHEAKINGVHHHIKEEVPQALNVSVSPPATSCASMANGHHTTSNGPSSGEGVKPMYTHMPPTRSKGKAPNVFCEHIGERPCKQRAVNSFKFCIRHILDDPSAPYQVCSYTKTSSSGNKVTKCTNAVRLDRNSPFCSTHLITLGMMVPKRKKGEKAVCVPESNDPPLASPVPARHNSHPSPTSIVAGSQSVVTNAHDNSHAYTNGNGVMYMNGGHFAPQQGGAGPYQQHNHVKASYSPGAPSPFSTMPQHNGAHGSQAGQLSQSGRSSSVASSIPASKHNSEPSPRPSSNTSLSFGFPGGPPGTPGGVGDPLSPWKPGQTPNGHGQQSPACLPASGLSSSLQTPMLSNTVEMLRDAEELTTKMSPSDLDAYLPMGSVDDALDDTESCGASANNNPFLHNGNPYLDPSLNPVPPPCVPMPHASSNPCEPQRSTSVLESQLNAPPAVQTAALGSGGPQVMVMGSNGPVRQPLTPQLAMQLSQQGLLGQLAHGAFPVSWAVSSRRPVPPPPSSTMTSSLPARRVIRLKQKRRPGRLMGEYRGAPVVDRLCTLIDDLDFDRQDLFPLGLEPSSSDTEGEEDAEKEGFGATQAFLSRVVRSEDAQLSDYLLSTPDRNSLHTDEDNTSCQWSRLNNPLRTKMQLPGEQGIAKRHLYLLKQQLRLERTRLKRAALEGSVMCQATALYPNLVGRATRDRNVKWMSQARQRNARRSARKSLRRVDAVIPVSLKDGVSDRFLKPRRCCATDSNNGQHCQSVCLPYSNHCYKHIVNNVEQRLFRYCTESGCSLGPVLDLGLPPGQPCGSLCPKHAKQRQQPQFMHTDDIQSETSQIKRKRCCTSNSRRLRKRGSTGRAVKDAADSSCPESPELGTERTESPSHEDLPRCSSKLSSLGETWSDSSECLSEAEVGTHDVSMASVAKELGLEDNDLLTEMLDRLPDDALTSIMSQDFGRNGDIGARAVEDTIVEVCEQRFTSAQESPGDHSWADVESFLLSEGFQSQADRNNMTNPNTSRESSRGALLPPPPPYPVGEPSPSTPFSGGDSVPSGSTPSTPKGTHQQL